MKIFNFFKIILGVTLLLSPVFVLAQSTSVVLNISMSPSNPLAEQSVTVSVSSISFNIDLADIVWSIDGKILQSGTGKKSFNTKAPSAGKSVTVIAKITPKGSEKSLEKSIVIAPGGDVDLIWEVTDGYVPPFYRGKTLPIKESRILVTAIPNVKSSSGVVAQPQDFVYSWKKDGTVMSGQSGFSKQSVFFTNQILDNNNQISVVASNGVASVNGLITVTPFQPEIIFYQYDNSSGRALYQKAFSSNNTIGKSRMQIDVEPFFLSKNFKTNPAITIDWKLNGTLANAGIKNILGVDASTPGTFSVEAQYKDDSKLFRDLKNTIKFSSQ